MRHASHQGSRDFVPNYSDLASSLPSIDVPLFPQSAFETNNTWLRQNCIKTPIVIKSFEGLCWIFSYKSHAHGPLHSVEDRSAVLQQIVVKLNELLEEDKRSSVYREDLKLLQVSQFFHQFFCSRITRQQ